jgi:hypothetical protein
MSTSPKKSSRGKKKSSRRRWPRRSPAPKFALAQSVEFDEYMMHVRLLDGRVLGVPLAWFSSLRTATTRQRRRYEIAGGGISLHWPELDEDISVAGLMAGADARSA